MKPSRYAVELAEYAAAAKAPRTPGAPTVISTFAGRGGSSTGYHMAGFHELLAVEWDAHAAATLRLNYPDLDVYHGDIAALSVDEALERTGLQVGELDLFDGSPPCFPVGTPVITEHGSLPIEQLSPGMRVLTHLGAYQPIQEVMRRQYSGDLITVQTKYGRSPVRATPEHPFWARLRLGGSPRRFSEPQWVAAEDLKPGDLLCEPLAKQYLPLPLGSIVFRHCTNIEGQSGRIKREIKLRERSYRLNWQTTEMAWVLGLYLAEGHTRGQRPTLEEAGPCRREVIFSVARHEVPAVCGRITAAGLIPKSQNHSKGTARVTVTDMDFWELCQCFGKYADGKFVPEPFQAMPEPWRKAFLDGYFTGDGCVSVSKRIQSAKRKATTVSRQLAEGIARMVASTEGLAATIEVLYPAGESVIEGRTVKVQQAYSVGYALPGSDRKRPAFVENGAAWIPVASVSRLPAVTEVLNLEVEDHHSYTAGGFAVHNCQGFSMMGQRQLDDPRNQLFREYLRLIAGLQPRTFVMENVRGMVTGKMRGIYREAMEAFAAAGYRTVSGVLNAAYLGVPQARERLIVIGVREDLGIQPTLPRPYSRTITVREALRDLPQTPDGYRILKPEWLAVYAKVKPGQDFGDIHPKGHFFSSRKIHPDRPSNTIVKTISLGKNGEAGGGVFHWRFPRLLTVPELKRLGGFPDDYQFAPGKDDVDTFIQTWAGIGNSVPPLMTRAIAQHVRDTVLERK